jgi:hypothetical protein
MFLSFTLLYIWRTALTTDRLRTEGLRPDWNVGVMEYWNDGFKGKNRQYALFRFWRPLFYDSNIPSFDAQDEKLKLQNSFNFNNFLNFRNVSHFLYPA